MNKKSKALKENKVMVEKNTTMLDRILDDYAKEKIPQSNQNTIKSNSSNNNDQEKEDKEIKQLGKSNSTSIVNKSSWSETDYLLIFNPYSIKKNLEKTYMLSFDMDGTIINTTSGKSYALNSNDWHFVEKDYDELIINKINELPKLLDLKVNEAKDFSIEKVALVIFSNQAGLEKGYLDKKMFKEKITKIFEKLTQKHKLESIWFFSSDEGYYRKASIGMFEYLKENYYPNIKSEYSIYVGDAAGRPANSNRHKDHSDTDYKFALNCNMKFFTPEEFITGVKERIPKFSFDPRTYKENLNGEGELDTLSYFRSLSKPLYDDLTNKTQIVVIFVGSPASGKSSFYFNHFKKLGFERVNNDILKSEKNCLKKLDKCLNEKISVVVDNTNPQKAKRKVYITPSLEKKVKVYCFHFNYDKDLVLHLNNQRKILKSLQSKSEVPLNYTDAVGKVTINTFFCRLEKPEKEEGFEDVINVEFRAGPFPTELHKKTFYLLS